jgi:hypothetical protein
LVASGLAKWDNGRRTRRISLINTGDSGDTDTSAENTGFYGEVSPNGQNEGRLRGDSYAESGDTSEPQKEANGDTSPKKPLNNGKVTPSPLSPPVEQENEREQFAL